MSDYPSPMLSVEKKKKKSNLVPVVREEESVAANVTCLVNNHRLVHRLVTHIIHMNKLMMNPSLFRSYYGLTFFLYG